MLTRELVAAAFPDPVADDRTAMPLMSSAEIDANRAMTLAAVRPVDDIWLFAYGSLMWKPEPGFADQIPAVLEGCIAASASGNGAIAAHARHRAS